MSGLTNVLGNLGAREDEVSRDSLTTYSRSVGHAVAATHTVRRMKADDKQE